MLWREDEYLSLEQKKKVAEHFDMKLYKPKHDVEVSDEACLGNQNSRNFLKRVSEPSAYHKMALKLQYKESVV